MSKKTKKNGEHFAQLRVLCQKRMEMRSILANIKRQLPHGAEVINKLPVKKEITKVDTNNGEIAWTCWFTIGGSKFLALLNANGNVKQIAEEDIKRGYKIRGVKEN